MRISTLLLALSAFFAGAAQAQVGTSLAIGHTQLNDADLGAGGQASVATSQFSISHNQPVSRETVLGIQLRAEREDWRFDSPTRFGTAPWGDIERYSVGIPLYQRLNESWTWTVTPRAEWAMEKGADSGEALTWGLTAGALKTFGPGQRLGFGAAAFDKLDDGWSVFPFFIVDWRFNERWRLFNPLGLGPAGPAGLELAYRFNDQWELGLGGSWRDASFRLAKDNPQSAGGIGKFSYLPVFLHLSWKPLPSLNLEAYAAMTVNGRLKVQNAQGDDVSKEDLANTPAFGLTASYRF